MLDHYDLYPVACLLRKLRKSLEHSSHPYAILRLTLLRVIRLPEQRAWRRFAHLPNRHRLPDAWMLHEFRSRCGVSGLRRINERLFLPLLPAADAWSVALIDATDLPAASAGFKKRSRGSIQPGARRPGRAR